MWKKLQRWFDRIESRWSLYTLLGGGGTVSAISGWIAAKTAWLSVYGTIAWWFAALLGGLIFAAIFLAICWGRWKMVEARAVNKWTKDVDSINPLEKEFRNQRIRLVDLANPVTKQIVGKRFIGCELVGPVTILLGPNGFRHSSFVEVNMIPVKNNYPMSRIYTMVGCDVIECQIMDANLLIPLGVVPTMEAGFPGGQIPYLSLTGDEAIDSRPHPDAGARMQP